ncbi:MAG TPA: tetratricopeptide repeat protein [Candidatus Deferrimicrobium sp.]|nr:tetratricopeptide repeat protein [Candidatus Deferrimicrobium sp.]
MYSKTKLSKRQIKEDKFAVFMLSAKSRLIDYWQYAVIGAAAVILIAVGIVYYVNSLQSRKQESSERMARAIFDYRAGNNQVAIMGLDQVVKEYGSEPAAEQAMFMLGHINYETRNYPEAIRYYEMYLAKYHDNQLNRAGALGGVAASMENQGQFQQAAAKFLEAYDEYPDGPQTGDYQFGAMRNLLETGDTAQAKVHLQIISEKFKDTDLERRARRLFSEKSQS